MPCIYLVSDFHFGHSNILKFTKKDGTLLRGHLFDNADQMNDCMIETYNSVVKPNDKVYILGDLAMDEKYLPLLGKLNGHKRLVLGNHDTPKMRNIIQYFQAVYSTRRLDQFILSHIPIHPDSLGKCLANIHGHLHSGNMFNEHLGPKYLEVCVESLGYKPISLEEAKEKILKRLENV